MKPELLSFGRVVSCLLLLCLSPALSQGSEAEWEAANPIVPIPDPPLGIGKDKEMPSKLTEFDNPPTPERVRLGRWLFFDKRLSGRATGYHGEPS